MPDSSADIERVRRIAKAAGWRRIGIDGVEGAGQSYLAEELSQGLDIPMLDLDHYLHQNQGGYVDFIDYPALSAAISSMPAFILSGMCVREVLENLGATLDAHIYIQRMRGGIWIDEEDCVFPDGIDAAIEERARGAAMVSNYFDERPERPGQGLGESPLQFADEVMHYHDKHQPQEIADLVFEQGDS